MRRWITVSSSLLHPAHGKLIEIAARLGVSPQHALGLLIQMLGTEEADVGVVWGATAVVFDEVWPDWRAMLKPGRQEDPAAVRERVAKHRGAPTKRAPRKKPAPPPPETTALTVVTVPIEDRIYNAYPKNRRIGGTKGKQAILRSLKSSGMSGEEMLRIVEAYTQQVGHEYEFTPHLITWFNQERWSNPSAWPRAGLDLFSGVRAILNGG